MVNQTRVTHSPRLATSSQVAFSAMPRTSSARTTTSRPMPLRVGRSTPWVQTTSSWLFQVRWPSRGRSDRPVRPSRKRSRLPHQRSSSRRCGGGRQSQDRNPNNGGATHRQENSGPGRGDTHYENARPRSGLRSRQQQEVEQSHRYARTPSGRQPSTLRPGTRTAPAPTGIQRQWPADSPSGRGGFRTPDRWCVKPELYH